MTPVVTEAINLMGRANQRVWPWTPGPLIGLAPDLVRKIVTGELIALSAWVPNHPGVRTL